MKKEQLLEVRKKIKAKKPTSNSSGISCPSADQERIIMLYLNFICMKLMH